MTVANNPMRQHSQGVAQSVGGHASWSGGH